MLKGSLRLIAIVVWAWSYGSWAGAYKWVDESGQVHYSERPPAGQTSQPMRLPEAPSASESATADPVPAEQMPQNTPAAESEQAARQALAETQRRNCSTARVNLQRLQGGRRVTAKSADGELTFLTDAEREERIAEAKAQLRANCK